MRLALILFCSFVLFISHNEVISLSLQFGDLTKSSMDLGKGILDKVPDVIPSPDLLLQMGKNAIAGYPFDLASKAINTFCKSSYSCPWYSITFYDFRIQVAPLYQLTKSNRNIHLTFKIWVSFWKLIIKIIWFH